jgi:hypothetical protein
MRFTRLSFRCPCGRTAHEVQDVGLSPQHELVIRWKCAKCENDIYVVKKLSDCWNECPVGGAEEEADEQNHPIVSDAQFLRALRVKWSDEEQGGN